uniref:DNA translocase FtsK 4TM domain-containing protein n=1 Tax=Mesorhizobium xinjiangense TaxID=2678685 RepID=UPI0018DE2EF6
MRPGSSQAFAVSAIGHGIQIFLLRQLTRLVGIGLLCLCAFAVAGLASWNVADPSFSHATSNVVTNAMGYPGAVFADLAMQFFGLASVAALIPAFAWGLRLAGARGLDRLPRRGLAWFGAALLSAAIAGCFDIPSTWPLPTGLGGVFGDLVLKVPGFFTGGYPGGVLAMITAVILAVPAVWMMLFASAVIGFERHEYDEEEEVVMPAARRATAEEFDDEEDDEDEGGGSLVLGAITHWWLSLRAFVRRMFGQRLKRRPPERDILDEFDTYDSDYDAPRPPVLKDAPRIEPDFEEDGFGGVLDSPSVEYDPEDDFDAPMPRVVRQAPAAAGREAARVEAPAPRP